MKKLPSIFVNDLEDKLNVVYTGDSFKPTPWFSAASVEALMGVKNPYGSANNRVLTVHGRITEYLNSHPDTKYIATGTPVVLLGSVKPAKMFADDGQYSILAVMSSKNATAKPSYYYNEAATFYVLTSAKTTVANEIQHWVNGVVMPTIRETGEFNLHRKDGIGLRRELTDAIKRGIDNKELNDSAYPSVTDAVYFIRFGMHAQYLRAALGIGDNENIREHMGQDDLDALAKIERSIGAALDAGMPLSQLLANERLIKLYRRNLI